ncbi:hypothetical protein [Lysobacter arvi]|uniref:Uncharacterized protein n=1 Tax=Lysobacter arvi TaxID=3038776 RepID=A0ABU1CF39_9GAMM|nr:hypothetical protein [Lysobacter arvi]MDR0183569.1 hypothetical protein [Lysobacter arvi]
MAVPRPARYRRRHGEWHGDPLDAYTYDPFGEANVTTGARFRYRGQWLIPELVPAGAGLIFVGLVMLLSAKQRDE